MKTGDRMETPHRTAAPPAAQRLHGGDRSDLGEQGWAEVGPDGIGAPSRADLPFAPLYPADAQRAHSRWTWRAGLALLVLAAAWLARRDRPRR